MPSRRTVALPPPLPDALVDAPPPPGGGDAARALRPARGPHPGWRACQELAARLCRVGIFLREIRVCDATEACVGGLGRDELAEEVAAAVEWAAAVKGDGVAKITAAQRAVVARAWTKAYVALLKETLFIYEVFNYPDEEIRASKVPGSKPLLGPCVNYLQDPEPGCAGEFVGGTETGTLREIEEEDTDEDERFPQLDAVDPTNAEARRASPRAAATAEEAPRGAPATASLMTAPESMATAGPPLPAVYAAASAVHPPPVTIAVERASAPPNPAAAGDSRGAAPVAPLPSTTPAYGRLDVPRANITVARQTTKATDSAVVVASTPAAAVATPAAAVAVPPAVAAAAAATAARAAVPAAASVAASAAASGTAPAAAQPVAVAALPVAQPAPAPSVETQCAPDSLAKDAAGGTASAHARRTDLKKAPVDRRLSDQQTVTVGKEAAQRPMPIADMKLGEVRDVAVEGSRKSPCQETPLANSGMKSIESGKRCREEEARREAMAKAVAEQQPQPLADKRARLCAEETRLAAPRRVESEERFAAAREDAPKKQDGDKARLLAARQVVEKKNAALKEAEGMLASLRSTEGQKHVAGAAESSTNEEIEATKGISAKDAASPRGTREKNDAQAQEAQQLLASECAEKEKALTAAAHARTERELATALKKQVKDAEDARAACEKKAQFLASQQAASAADAKFKAGERAVAERILRAEQFQQAERAETERLRLAAERTAKVKAAAAAKAEAVMKELVAQMEQSKKVEAERVANEDAAAAAKLEAKKKAAEVEKKRTVAERADREKKRLAAERVAKAKAVTGTKLQANSDAAVSIAASKHSVEAGIAATTDHAVTNEKTLKSAGLVTEKAVAAEKLATETKVAHVQCQGDMTGQSALKSQVEMKDREGNIASCISSGSGDAGPTAGLVANENRKEAAERITADKMDAATEIVGGRNVAELKRNAEEVSEKQRLALECSAELEARSAANPEKDMDAAAKLTGGAKAAELVEQEKQVQAGRQGGNPEKKVAVVALASGARISELDDERGKAPAMVERHGIVRKHKELAGSPPVDSAARGVQEEAQLDASAVEPNLTQHGPVVPEPHTPTVDTAVAVVAGAGGVGAGFASRPLEQELGHAFGTVPVATNPQTSAKGTATLAHSETARPPPVVLPPCSVNAASSYPRLIEAGSENGNVPGPVASPMATASGGKLNSNLMGPSDARKELDGVGEATVVVSKRIYPVDAGSSSVLESTVDAIPRTINPAPADGAKVASGWEASRRTRVSGLGGPTAARSPNPPQTNVSPVPASPGGNILLPQPVASSNAGNNDIIDVDSEVQPRTSASQQQQQQSNTLTTVAAPSGSNLATGQRRFVFSGNGQPAVQQQLTVAPFQPFLSNAFVASVAASPNLPKKPQSVLDPGRIRFGDLFSLVKSKQTRPDTERKATALFLDLDTMCENIENPLFNHVAVGLFANLAELNGIGRPPTPAVRLVRIEDVIEGDEYSYSTSQPERKTKKRLRVSLAPGRRGEATCVEDHNITSFSRKDPLRKQFNQYRVQTSAEQLPSQAEVRDLIQEATNNFQYSKPSEPAPVADDGVAVANLSSILPLSSPVIASQAILGTAPTTAHTTTGHDVEPDAAGPAAPDTTNDTYYDDFDYNSGVRPIQSTRSVALRAPSTGAGPVRRPSMAPPQPAPVQALQEPVPQVVAAPGEKTQDYIVPDLDLHNEPFVVIDLISDDDDE